MMDLSTACQLKHDSRWPAVRNSLNKFGVYKITNIKLYKSTDYIILNNKTYIEMNNFITTQINCVLLQFEKTYIMLVLFS